MSDGLAKMKPPFWPKDQRRLQQPQKDRKNSWRPGSISWTHNQVLVLAGHSLRSSASLPGGDLEVQVREKCLSIPKLSESITMVCVDMSIPSMTHFTAEHELPILSLCLSHLYPFIHATTASENKVTRNPKVNHHFSLVQNAVFGW